MIKTIQPQMESAAPSQRPIADAIASFESIFDENTVYGTEKLILTEYVRRSSDIDVLTEVEELFGTLKDFAEGKVHPLTFQTALMYPIAKRALARDDTLNQNAKRALKTYSIYSPDAWKYASGIIGDIQFLDEVADKSSELDIYELEDIAADRIQPQSIVLGAVITLVGLKASHRIKRRQHEHDSELLYERVCGYTGFDGLKSALINAREKSEADDPEYKKYEQIARMALGLVGEREEIPHLFAVIYKELFDAESINQHSLGDVTNHGIVVTETLLVNPVEGVESADAVNRLKTLKSLANKIRRETEDFRKNCDNDKTYPFTLTYDGETFILPVDILAGTVVTQDVNEQMIVFTSMINQIKNNPRLKPIATPSRYTMPGGEKKFIHVRGSKKFVKLGKLCLANIAGEDEIDDRENEVRKAYTVVKATYLINMGSDDEPLWLPVETQIQSRGQRRRGRVGSRAAHGEFKVKGKDEANIKSSGKAMRRIRAIKDGMNEDIYSPETYDRGKEIRGKVNRFRSKTYFTRD